MGKKRTSKRAGRPYRYAGQRWWADKDFDGINPDLEKGPPGYEQYHSIRFLRAAAKEGWGLGRPPSPGGALAKLGSLLPGEVTHALDGRDRALADAIEALNRWAQDMTSWARAVREDLLALEARIGQKGGDPGEPPPVPWK